MIGIVCEVLGVLIAPGVREIPGGVSTSIEGVYVILEGNTNGPHIVARALLEARPDLFDILGGEHGLTYTEVQVPEDNKFRVFIPELVPTSALVTADMQDGFTRRMVDGRG